MFEGYEFDGKFWKLNRNNCPADLVDKLPEIFTRLEFEYKLSKTETYGQLKFKEAHQARWVEKVKAWIPQENLPSSFKEAMTPKSPTELGLDLSLIPLFKPQQSDIGN